MILFRLFDFVVRVFASFFFVFLLQVQFDGQTLESYLTSFGKNFFLTKTLNAVGKDGVKMAKNFNLSKEEKEKKREIANEKVLQTFEKLSKRISLPSKEESSQKN